VRVRVRVRELTSPMLLDLVYVIAARPSAGMPFPKSEIVVLVSHLQSACAGAGFLRGLCDRTLTVPG
jgi:hypothetical protein